MNVVTIIMWDFFAAQNNEKTDSLSFWISIALMKFFFCFWKYFNAFYVFVFLCCWLTMKTVRVGLAWPHVIVSINVFASWMSCAIGDIAIDALTSTHRWSVAIGNRTCNSSTTISTLLKIVNQLKSTDEWFVYFDSFVFFLGTNAVHSGDKTRKICDRILFSF